ncbi:hypothetical protein PIB30_091226 [Stylosanthes scabra]|uniref:Uncharacterized protein n=1 Tax=Stylosanthes scabra TaxID=79078 RepID=A0ABU6VY55_9FABA|nr:hypothetical protein [Stylosanthes scabra]
MRDRNTIHKIYSGSAKLLPTSTLSQSQLRSSTITPSFKKQGLDRICGSATPLHGYSASSLDRIYHSPPRLLGISTVSGERPLHATTLLTTSTATLAPNSAAATTTHEQGQQHLNTTSQRYGRNGHGSSEGGELRHHQQLQRRYFLPVVTPIDGDRAAAWNRGFFKHQRRRNKPEDKGGGIGIHGGDSIVVQPPPSRFLSLAPFFSADDGMVWSAKARRGGKGSSAPAAPWSSIASAVVHLLPPVSKPVLPFPLAFCVRVFVYRLGLCI